MPGCHALAPETPFFAENLISRTKKPTWGNEPWFSKKEGWPLRRHRKTLVCLIKTTANEERECTKSVSECNSDCAIHPLLSTWKCRIWNWHTFHEIKLNGDGMPDTTEVNWLESVTDPWKREKRENERESARRSANWIMITFFAFWFLCVCMGRMSLIICDTLD